MTKHSHKDYFFEDTVIDFYQNSNEVDEFYNVFKSHIISRLGTQSKSLKWLDVGIGNGEKVLRILPLFKQKPSITFLEPSNRWVNELTISGNLDKIRTDTKIKGSDRTFEDFINYKKNFDFDLISFIQVLYEPYLVDVLFDFIDSKRNTIPFYLIINLENDENDLFKIRKQIAEKNIEVPISRLSMIETGLRKREIKFIKFNSKNKSLNISTDEIIQTDNHWFYPFIMGVSKNDFLTIKHKEKVIITKIINNFIIGLSSVCISDSYLLVKIK